ncbi:hypothetical protein C2S51_009010 [Perilla frutescens var. frutescens]|nr:hypothetical protein C2S51_009010 [Perilla frutescens var. frutescens]
MKKISELGFSTLPNSSDIPSPVYNPTPLRWYRPPEEGVDSPIDHHHHVETPSNPTVLDDHDGADAVEVDTTLRLSNYVAGNPTIPPAEINPPPPLGLFRPDFFDGVEDDEVDTTLSLRPPGSTDHNKSRKLLQAKKGKIKAEADADDVGDDRPKKRRSRRSNNGDDEDQRPLIPIELIPGLQNIVSGNGTRPTFLYRKKLAESDVRRDQNRLFATRRERMMEFLREEEAAVVDGGGKGLKIVGVDGGGKVYENLGLRKWASLKMTVINSDWWRLVAANNAITGDVVEIWGYRENEKPFFAFNFRRENGGDINAASTSGTKASSE